MRRVLKNILYCLPDELMQKLRIPQNKKSLYAELFNAYLLVFPYMFYYYSHIMKQLFVFYQYSKIRMEKMSHIHGKMVTHAFKIK